MRTPLVSILIPAYNAEKWIRDALESALAQTWPNKEIIVVDDGSTDNTLAVAGRLGTEGLRVIQAPHEGAFAARNRALAESKGDFIQWLDADDILASDKVELQLKAATQCSSNRTLFSAPFGRFIYRSSHARFVPSVLWRDLHPVEWMQLKLSNDAWIQTASWLVSRELTNLAGPWHRGITFDDDGEYFCRIVRHSDKVIFVPEARVYYRTVGFGNLGYLGTSVDKYQSFWLSMRLHIETILAMEDSPRSRAACVKYLQRHLIEFYPDYGDIVRQAEDLARTLGGKLVAPSVGWKYHWLRKLLGWRRMKDIQRKVRYSKWLFKQGWDKLMLCAAI